LNRVKRQQVAILGATGSIGRSTLDVLARHPGRYEVFALSGFSRLAQMTELCLAHRPKHAVVASEEDAQKLRQSLQDAGIACEVQSGAKALQSMASHPQVDTVMAAIVGAAGLLPTLAAVRAEKSAARQQRILGDVRRTADAGGTGKRRDIAAD